MDSVVPNKKIKLKKKFLIFIILSILIILLFGLGSFIYFYDGNTKEIYNKLIDNAKDEFINLLEETSEKYKMSGQVGFEFTSDTYLTYEDEVMLDIVNNLDINYILEIDKTVKNANLDLDVKYENKNMFDFNMLANDKNTFLDLGTLYNKTIKLNDEDTIIGWVSKEDRKILLEELIKIFKNNLKEEYFSKEKEKLTINDKNVLTTKHTISLNSKQIYDLEINIIDDIKKNDKILEILVKINNCTIEDMIGNLNSYRNELVEDKELSFSIDIYLKLFTKDMVKLVVSTKEEKISLINVQKGYYDITYTKGGLANLVGNLIIKDDSIEITYDYQDLKFKYEKKNGDINITLEENKIKVNLNSVINSNKNNYLGEIIIEDNGLKLKITINGVTEDIDKISDKAINEYINIDDMTDEDYSEIYHNLYENETIMTLIEDAYYVYENYVEYYNSIESPYYNDGLETPTF